MKRFVFGSMAISVALLAAGLAVSGGTISAQAHTADGHPASIEHGTCDQLGEVAYRLTGVGATVNAEGTPIAEPMQLGAEAAVGIEASQTDLKQSLTELTKNAYAIVVFKSDEATDSIIACGDVGGLLVAPQMAGMVMPGDELAIGLAPQADPGATGIALLRSVEGGTSSLRIFLTEGRSEEGTPAAVSGATPTNASPAAAEEVGCSSMEQLTYHVHAHLAIFVERQPVTVPANVGIRADCIAWLHTHDTSGVIHVEAPAPHSYPLGAFFQVWGQPLDSAHLLDRTIDTQHEIRAFVDGRRYHGAPETILLDPHADIVLEYGPPFVEPPSYAFPPGL